MYSHRKQNENLSDFENALLQYRLYLFQYGLLSVLYVMKYFESMEQYEECEIICIAIAEQSERLNIDISTQLNDFTIKEIAKEFKIWGMNKVIEVHKYYATIILKEITQKEIKL